jgi:hypothetical protein
MTEDAMVPLYELFRDGYGTLLVIYWGRAEEDDETWWIVPGTLDPLDD